MSSTDKFTESPAKVSLENGMRLASMNDEAQGQRIGIDDEIIFGGEDMSYSSMLGSGSLDNIDPLEVRPSENDMSPFFFKNMFVSDPKQQERALMTITAILRESLHSPASIEASFPLIRSHLASIVRFSTESPFQRVCEVFSEFLAEIKEDLIANDIPIPDNVQQPSSFFAPSVILPINCEIPEVKRIFQSSFLATGRVSHLTRLLAWHPGYYDRHLEYVNMIMKGPGPLPPHWRNVVAMMAAASFKCSYLVQEQDHDYIRNHGPPEWRAGYHALPTKLQRLHKLNCILATTPWEVKKEDIEELTTGSDAWSITEIVHALAIMSHFRALAGFCLGMGVTPEVDFEFKEKVEFSTEEDEILSADSASGEDTVIIDMLRQHKDEPCDEISISGRVKLFADLEGGDENAMFNSSSAADGSSNEETFERQWSQGLETRFTHPFSSQHYNDFDLRAKHYDIFHVQDYAWSTHGFSLVKRYYSGAAELLDEEFSFIRNLTYRRFGTETIDTKPFRLSIWYYVHRIHGLFHDDYNYKNVNDYVGQRTKKFVKTITTVPSKIKRTDILNLGGILPSEKAHIALLAAEARKQAELLYGLHAVMKWRTG